MIYFIKAGEYVKIGYSKSTSALRDRMDTIQTSNPETITLLGVLFGDRETEAKLHYLFRHLWVRGEWFRLREDLALFIEEKAVEDKKLAKPRRNLPNRDGQSQRRRNCNT